MALCNGDEKTGAENQGPENRDGRHLQGEVAPSMNKEYQGDGNAAADPGCHAPADANTPGGAGNNKSDAEKYRDRAGNTGLFQPLQVHIMSGANIPEHGKIQCGLEKLVDLVKGADPVA